MRASGLESAENSRKVAIFLHYVGPEALSIFNSFGLDMDDCNFEGLVKQYEQHCKPKKNLTVERHNFLTRTQKVNENIEEFLTDLKNLSIL